MKSFSLGMVLLGISGLSSHVPRGVGGAASLLLPWLQAAVHHHRESA